MNRRTFFGRGLGSFSMFWTAGRAGWPQADESSPQRFDIQYIRKDTPEFAIPPYRGEWYEDTIPDTLDLTERLRLAAYCSNSMADPRADGEVFWLVDFLRNPPTMMHDFNDWVLPVEGLLEGVPLARLATGSTENEEIDRIRLDFLGRPLRAIGPRLHRRRGRGFFPHRHQKGSSNHRRRHLQPADSGQYRRLNNPGRREHAAVPARAISTGKCAHGKGETLCL